MAADLFIYLDLSAAAHTGRPIDSRLTIYYDNFDDDFWKKEHGRSLQLPMSQQHT